MSETTNEVPTVTRESLDDLGQMMLSRIDSWDVEAKSCQAILAAADSDDAKAMVVTLRDTHDDYPEYLDLIAKAEGILATIDKSNEDKVEKPTDSQVESAKAELGSLKDQAKAALQFLIGAYGEGAKELMPASLKAKRGGGKGCNGNQAAPYAGYSSAG